ncbi:MAG: GntR family transcriptional regulator [Pseudonocardiaceae bacterium]
MSPLDPVGHLDETSSTKADEIAHAIEEMIVTARLPAGAVLRQDDLARRFGVSRTPIREALRKLSALGLVDFSANRGVRVRSLDRDEWTQAFLARAALEGVAAELAAGRLDAKQHAELDAAHEEFIAHTARLRDPALSTHAREQCSLAWVAANERFHSAIMHGAEAPLIERLVSSVRRVFSGEALWASGSAVDELYRTNIEQHEAIRQALRVGSAAAARVLVQEHILDSWRLLQAVLDEAQSVEARPVDSAQPTPDMAISRSEV